MNISDNLMINNNLLKGVFWLILMCISAVAIVPTYSKQFINLISKNDIIKHICIIWSIYFLIDFTDNKYANPLETLYQSLIIWVGYVIISKQHSKFNVINFILISLIYSINSYNDYLINTNKMDKNDDRIKKLNMISNILVVILIITTFIGLLQFYNYKKEYKKTNFEYIKFIFGSKI